MSELADATPEEVRLAMKRAKESFGPFRTLSGRKRSSLLCRIAEKIKGSKDFNVVTIATMRNSPKSVENFFNKMSIDNLTKYQDPKGKLARSLKIAGLPLTILLNKDNKEVARFIGDADWSSPHALNLIEKATEIDLKN